MESPEVFRQETGELMQIVEGALELNLLPYAIIQIDSNYGNSALYRRSR